MESIAGSYTSFSTASFTRAQSAAPAQKRPEEPAGPSSSATGAEATSKGDTDPRHTPSSTSGEPSDRLTLSSEERATVEELKKRDSEVRAHEQAHLAAAGSYARGGAHYEYQRGPDRRRYAVGGEVQMDTSSVAGSPEDTIRKMQTVKRAALAPAEPSAQDYKVAASADMKASRARQELLRQLDEKSSTGRSAQQTGSVINIVV